MSDDQQLNNERLVQVFKARDEMQGELVASVLRENGVEVMVRQSPSMPPLDVVERSFMLNEKTGGVFVLEHEAERARALVQDFLATAVDEKSLDDLAAQKPHPDKETIGQLRVAVREERRTFRFLGWTAAAVLLAAVLRISGIQQDYRWFITVFLIAAAIVVGNWLRKKS